MNLEMRYQIADRLASLAQLLSTQKENPYKVKAYQRAAAKIRNLSESLDELVRDDADLTRLGKCQRRCTESRRRCGFDGLGDQVLRQTAAAIDSVTQWKENTLGKPQTMARMMPRTAMWLWLIFGGIFAASGLTAFLSAIGGAGLLQTLRFIVAGCFLMISAACFRNAWNANRDDRKAALACGASPSRLPRSSSS